MDEHWHLTDLESIGDHRTEIGAPELVDIDAGPAVEFDGVGDANLLAGLEAFTAEVVFAPHPDGPAAQRVFHIQENGSDNRLLFETRLTADDRWFLDTFIMTEGEGYVHRCAAQPRELVQRSHPHGAVFVAPAGARRVPRHRVVSTSLDAPGNRRCSWTTRTAGAFSTARRIHSACWPVLDL